MASIRFAGGRSSMTCAPSRIHSWKIGNIFTTPYKNSNATAVLPIIGSS